MGVIRLVYWLETDTFFDDPVWERLVTAGGGRGRGALYDALKASYCDMKAFASRHGSDGYLTAERVLYLCRGKQKLVDLLCTSVLGKSALVHREGADCACLPGGVWREGYDFYLHQFLKRNPARAETDRDRAQKANLVDARLKALVYERDAGCCRYCRSGPLSSKANNRTKDRRKILHHDHVDPDKQAGPDGEGFVVACARCNEEKGRRTPGEADMVLLREPTAAERVEWAERGQVLFERADWGPEHADIIGGSSVTSSPDHQTDHQSLDDAADVRTDDPTDDAGADVTGEVRPDSAGQASEHPLNQAPEGPGSGRVGEPHETGHDAGPRTPPRKPPEHQPVRASTEPDIYHGRSRASPAPDLPPLHWPPGSVPAESRRRRQDPSEEEKPPWT